MSCRFCKKSPLNLVRRVDRDINEGSLSIVDLMDKHNVPLKALRTHMKKCLGGTPVTGYSLLQKNLRSLAKLGTEAKEEMDSINMYDEGSGAAKGFAMKRVLEIKKEEREYVMALDRIKPSDQLMDEILNSTISPLVIKTTELCAQELGRLRKDLSSQLDDDVYVHIDTAVKDALHRIGERLAQEVKQIQPRLKKILNSEHAKKGKSTGRPRGRSSSKSVKGTPVH